jgi:hypothetical protein
MVYTHGSPYPYIVYSPSEKIPVLTWTVIGLLAVVAALIAMSPRRMPASLTAQPTCVDETGMLGHG